MSQATFFGEISSLNTRAVFEDSDDEAEKKELESVEEQANKLEPRINLSPVNADFVLPKVVTKLIVSITDLNHSLWSSSNFTEKVVHLTTITPNTTAYGKKETDSNAVKGVKVSVAQSKVDPSTAWIAFNKLPHVTRKSGRLVEVTHEVLSFLLPSNDVKRQLVVMSHEKIPGKQVEQAMVFLNNQFFAFDDKINAEKLKSYKLMPPGHISSPVEAYAFQYATQNSLPAIALVIPDPDELAVTEPVGTCGALIESLIPSDLRQLMIKGSVFLSSYLDSNIFT